SSYYLHQLSCSRPVRGYTTNNRLRLDHEERTTDGETTRRKVVADPRSDQGTPEQSEQGAGRFNQRLACAQGRQDRGQYERHRPAEAGPQEPRRRCGPSQREAKAAKGEEGNNQ